MEYAISAGIIILISVAFIAFLAVVSYFELQYNAKREQRRKQAELAQMRRIREELSKIQPLPYLNANHQARELRRKRLGATKARRTRQSDMFDDRGYDDTSCD
ncbi:hypothetical protein VPHD479_0142 [Vibrio phage D479]